MKSIIFIGSMCENLPPLFNGDLDCSNGNAVDSVCEFVCNHGFVRQGVHETKCLETSEGTRWSDVSTICLPSKLTPLC